LEDWLANITKDGVRDMCCWEQYCRFAREPESRKVGINARVTIDGTVWEVDPDMAGETIILLWGLFDEEMYGEFASETWGPYYPPLHRYRTFRRGKAAERADSIHALARQLNIPISALSSRDLRVVNADTQQCIDELPHQPFDTQKFEYHFPGVIVVKLTIADFLATPPARKSDEDRSFIDSILSETLNRSAVLAASETIFVTDNQEKTMRVEVMGHYGLTQSIEQAGYYETAHHKQLMKDIKGAMREGRLIAVCGVVRSGKTVTLHRLQQQLLDENKIIVSRSLSVDKHSVRLATLINALFYDLAQDKQVQTPKQGERRERELQELVKKGKRPWHCLLIRRMT
jgi:hypothetical protein